MKAKKLSKLQQSQLDELVSMTIMGALDDDLGLPFVSERTDMALDYICNKLQKYKSV